MTEQDAPLRAYSTKKLAAPCGIDVRTFERRIEPQQAAIGPGKEYLYNPLQVEIIFSQNGWPKVKVGR